MGRAIGPGTRYDVGSSDNHPPSPLPPGLYLMFLKFLRVTDKIQVFFCDKTGGIRALGSKGLPLVGRARDPLSTDLFFKKKC